MANRVRCSAGETENPVEQHHLACDRQVRHETLEVPLRFLEVCGLFQRDHPCSAGVEVFHEPLNGAALAGRVATFEDDHVSSGQPSR
jgi:hypothetical protein